MDYLNIAILTLAAIGVVGLAFMGGYERGLSNGISGERQFANRRIAGLLAQENKRKPRTRRSRK